MKTRVSLKYVVNDCRLISAARISVILLLGNKNIKLFIYFKNGKQLHINNCGVNKLINEVINWSVGSYLCEKQINKYKENIWQTT